MAALVPGATPGIDALRAAVAAPEGLARAVGLELLRDVGRRFGTQTSADGTAWTPRAVPNLPGVLRDLEAGIAPQAKRFRPQPALIDTGELLRSYRAEHRAGGGIASIRIVSSVPYADITRGGRRTVRVPRRLSPRIRSLFRTHVQHRRSWAFLMGIAHGAQQYDTTVPERSIDGTSSEARREITRLILDDVRGALR